MDPTANLAEQLRIAARIIERHDRGDSNAEADAEDCDRLAELVQALNQWLSGGGFVPEQWRTRLQVSA